MIMYLFAVADGVSYHGRPGACVAPTRPFSREERAQLQAAVRIARGLYGLTDSQKYKGVLPVTPPVRVTIAGRPGTAILFGILVT